MLIKSQVVQARRHALGYSQSYVAKQAHIHLSTVGLAERHGRVSEEAARAIAKVLGLGLKELQTPAPALAGARDE